MSRLERVYLCDTAGVIVSPGDGGGGRVAARFARIEDGEAD